MTTCTCYFFAAHVHTVYSYHWDPPAMAHAKITPLDEGSGSETGSGSGRKGFEMSSYDTDLWFNYPDVMRRSASESPLSAYRSPHPHAQSGLMRKGETSRGMSKAKRSDRDSSSHAIRHVLHDDSVAMRLGTYSPPTPKKR